MKENNRSKKISSKNKFELATELALRFLKVGNSRADIFILTGKEMILLKEKTTGKTPPKAPDVLSFVSSKGFPQPGESKKILGEIYLNRDIVIRDPARGVFLAIHGLLHLLGYSHSKKNDTLKMESLEVKIIDKIKIFRN